MRVHFYTRHVAVLKLCQTWRILTLFSWCELQRSEVIASFTLPVKSACPPKRLKNDGVSQQKDKQVKEENSNNEEIINQSSRVETFDDLSGNLPYSGPLHSRSENQFPSNFAHEIILV